MIKKPVKREIIVVFIILRFELPKLVVSLMIEHKNIKFIFSASNYSVENRRVGDDRYLNFAILPLFFPCPL